MAEFKAGQEGSPVAKCTSTVAKLLLTSNFSLQAASMSGEREYRSKPYRSVPVLPSSLAVSLRKLAISLVF